MSLLSKTLSVAKKATESLVDAAGRKIDDVAKKQKDDERSFLQSIPYNNVCVLLQNNTMSIAADLWEILERDSYVVYDVDQQPLYIAKGTLLMGKHHFIITNPNKVVCGKVNKALFKMPMPFVKERASCTVELPNREPFTLETMISFDGREYSSSLREIRIVADEKEKEFRIIRAREKKPVAHIYKTRSFAKGTFFNDKYYIAFDNKKDELLAINIALAIDLIRFNNV